MTRKRSQVRLLLRPFFTRRPGTQAPAPAPPANDDAAPADVVPSRFDLRDVVVLRQRGQPLARVGQILEDGRLRVWVLETSGGPQRWVGPRTVLATDVIKNFGPLDDVGIGAKIRDKL